MKRAIIIADTHIDEKTPKAYQLVKRFIKKEHKHIDIAILNGDFADVNALNDWDKDKPKLLENKRYIREVANVNKELDFLQKYIKKIVYIEGNHENRATRAVEKEPHLEGMLEIPEVLHLKERGIQWVPDNIYEETGTFYKLSKVYFHHALSCSQNAAKAIMMKLGCNMCCGHLHREMMFMLNMAMQEPMVVHIVGCLCSKQPAWKKGNPTGWANQFAIMDYNKDIFDFNVITIIKNKFIYNGKEYK